MITLRLHSALYTEDAIAAALEVYSPWADLERGDEEPYVLVKIQATGDVSEERLENELATYALARTIEQKRSQ